MKLRLFHTFCPELKELSEALEPVSQHHIFQTYGWISFWQEVIGNHTLRIRPWIAVVLDENGSPRMAFYLGIRGSLGARIVEFLGGAQSDYQGPLIHNEWLAQLPKVELAWNLVQKSLPPHDVYHFVKLPSQWVSAKNPMLKIWAPRPQEYSYAARLPSSIGEFQTQLRPKLRSDNDRQRRRLSKVGVLEFEIPEDEAQRNSALEIMITQKRTRCRMMGIPDLFSDSHIRQFYREIVEKTSNAGRIHFSVLRLDDEILATHWGAVYRNRFYFLMPTYDSQKWSPYSPGRLLLQNLIAWCIENRIEIFDFTIGGEEYKRDWCNEEMPLFEHLRPISSRGIPYVIYIRLRRRARRNKHIWSIIKTAYSLFRYEKHNAPKA